MESGFQIENVLGNLMANPELLSGVLSMAGKLAQNLTPPQKEEPQVVEALLPEPQAQHTKRHEMHKHKKLVEALMLYVGEEKRPKLEMVLKILEIVELAESLRG